MSERWALNASPLILLGHAGQLDLIASLAAEAIIPESVAQEIRAGPVDDPSRRWLDADAARIVATPPALPELLAWDLGAGETAVLAYAMATPGWTAILDDAAARTCARGFSVPVKGTLAIIVMARQRGLIQSAADVIRKLISAGFRIDSQTIRTVLAQTVGEEWPAGAE